MSRYVAGTGIDVYDTDTDSWYRIEDAQERERFLNFAENEPVEDYPYDNPPEAQYPAIHDTITESRGGSDFSAFSFNITSTTVPISVLPLDVTRRYAQLYCQASGGGLLIGSRQGLSAQANPQGYFLQNGLDLKLETTAEIWCVGTGAINAVVLYVAVVRNG